MRLALLCCFFASTLVACEPSCKETCKKLLECEDVDTPRVALEQCDTTCEVQENLYESWDDLGKREKMADMKRCISDEECSDIADGACYDEDLYIW